MRWIPKLGVVSLCLCTACLGDLGEADASQEASSAAPAEADMERPNVQDGDTRPGVSGGTVSDRPPPAPGAQGGVEPSISVPAGFAVNVFARDAGDSRSLVAHAGHVYAARALEGDIVRFDDHDADGVADRQVRVAECFEGVHGLVFHESRAFFATPSGLYRAEVDGAGDFTAPVALLKDLVSGGPRPKHGLASDGTALFLSTGSSCEACVEEQAERATIARIAFDASSRTVYARGLRNPLALAASEHGLWSLDSQPAGEAAFVLELNAIEESKDYGWPYCFGDAQSAPAMSAPPGETGEAFCARSAAPRLMTEVDAEPHGLVFAARGALPAPYDQGAFVTLRGLRQHDVASRVLFIGFDVSGPSFVADFVSALRDPQTGAFVSLSGITIADDGSLLVADDVNGLIYRIHPS